jgi:hypothetical protein
LSTSSIPDQEADIHFSSQHRHLTGADGTPLADFVGRFESLADHVAAVSERIGHPGIFVPHLYRTEHAHDSSYFSASTRKLVGERWAEDIDRFGYRFEAA